MTSPKMRLYLILECEMMSLDDTLDPFADQLRDLMDSLWRSLSDEEHVQLDNRNPAWSRGVLDSIRLVQRKAQQQSSVLMAEDQKVFEALREMDEQPKKTLRETVEGWKTAVPTKVLMSEETFKGTCTCLPGDPPCPRCGAHDRPDSLVVDEGDEA